MTEAYTADTPQSHQCGGIAQSAQRIDKLQNAVVVVTVGEDGEATIINVNYNAILTHATKAIQENNEVVNQQQLQIEATKLTESYTTHWWQQDTVPLRPSYQPQPTPHQCKYLDPSCCRTETRRVQ